MERGSVSGPSAKSLGCCRCLIKVVQPSCHKRCAALEVYLPSAQAGEVTFDAETVVGTGDGEGGKRLDDGSGWMGSGESACFTLPDHQGAGGG